jgi:hypothetical protein
MSHCDHPHFTLFSPPPPSQQVLKLQDNLIGDAGAVHLADGLEAHGVLEVTPCVVEKEGRGVSGGRSVGV